MQIGLVENDKVFATKWQFRNNPVRSAGSDSTSYLNPERVQHTVIEPLQGSSSDFFPPVAPVVIQIQALQAF